MINSDTWKLWPKFCPQMIKFWPSQTFPFYVEYDFVKERQKNNFHSKNRKIYSGVWKLYTYIYLAHTNLH